MYSLGLITRHIIHHTCNSLNVQSGDPPAAMFRLTLRLGSGSWIILPPPFFDNLAHIFATFSDLCPASVLTKRYSVSSYLLQKFILSHVNLSVD